MQAASAAAATPAWPHETPEGGIDEVVCEVQVPLGDQEEGVAQFVVSKHRHRHTAMLLGKAPEGGVDEVVCEVEVPLGDQEEGVVQVVERLLPCTTPHGRANGHTVAHRSQLAGEHHDVHAALLRQGVCLEGSHVLAQLHSAQGSVRVTCGGAVWRISLGWAASRLGGHPLRAQQVPCEQAAEQAGPGRGELLLSACMAIYSLLEVWLTSVSKVPRARL